MKRMCAWCNKAMGTRHSDIRSETFITHGICDACINKFFGARGVELMAFLDSLAAPVLVVDPTGIVKTANRQARSLLKRDLSDIEGYKGGDVFECTYAALEEGCGNTIHCSGCTIRRTVMDTLKSGQSHLKTPAYLNRGTPEDCQKIDLLISTEKVGEVVLLRIDKLGGNTMGQPSAVQLEKTSAERKRHTPGLRLQLTPPSSHPAPAP